MRTFLKRNRLLYCLFAICSLQVACAHVEAPHYERFPPTHAVPYQEAALYFYHTNEAYGEFSNFALFPVFVDGQWWPSSEHYYQAHKYEKSDLIAWVQAAPTAREAFNRGRDKNLPKRADWDERKDEVMEKAVMDKFSRYPSLRKLLLSTGTARLYEHTQNDCYWADCGDGTGKNKLGLLLEKVRDFLKNSAVVEAH